MTMKKCLWTVLAVPFMMACSSDDTDIIVPAPEIEQHVDYRDSLSEYSKEAARRLVGKWKEVYSRGWTPSSLEKVETNDYNYLTFYEDGRMEWSSDSLPWDSNMAANTLRESGYKAYGYRIYDDWEFDENSRSLSGYIGYRILIDNDNNPIDNGERYYLLFGENDQYELYMIEAPLDYINCFGYGRGYIRVE